jgi:hypothetical protein
MRKLEGNRADLVAAARRRQLGDPACHRRLRERHRDLADLHHSLRPNRAPRTGTDADGVTTARIRVFSIGFSEKFKIYFKI